MSDYNWMTIQIGGKISKAKFKNLYEIICEEMNDITGPDSVKDLPCEAKWQGNSNYGECDEVKKFCELNGLSYRHYYAGTCEYNAGIYYWQPGMKSPGFAFSDNDAEVVVQAGEIRPIVAWLITLAESGSDKSDRETFSKTMNLSNKFEKKFSRFPETIKELVGFLKSEIDRIIPVLPDVPKLELK